MGNFPKKEIVHRLIELILKTLNMFILMTAFLIEKIAK